MVRPAPRTQQCLLQSPTESPILAPGPALCAVLPGGVPPRGRGRSEEPCSKPDRPAASEPALHLEYLHHEMGVRMSQVHDWRTKQPFPHCAASQREGASLQPQNEQTHLRHCDDGWRESA
jgi:hypothetical protein